MDDACRGGLREHRDGEGLAGFAQAKVGMLRDENRVRPAHRHLMARRESIDGRDQGQAARRIRSALEQVGASASRYPRVVIKKLGTHQRAQAQVRGIVFAMCLLTAWTSADASSRSRLDWRTPSAPRAAWTIPTPTSSPHRSGRETPRPSPPRWDGPPLRRGPG